MTDWQHLVRAVLRKKPILMQNPDPHFIKYLTRNDWEVERLSGTEKYRAFYKEEK